MKMGRMGEAKNYLLKAEEVDRDYILTQLTLRNYMLSWKIMQRRWSMRG